MSPLLSGSKYSLMLTDKKEINNPCVIASVIIFLLEQFGQHKHQLGLLLIINILCQAKTYKKVIAKGVCYEMLCIYSIQFKMYTSAVYICGRGRKSKMK
jgi:hypothetical protein